MLQKLNGKALEKVVGGETKRFDVEKVESKKKANIKYYITVNSVKVYSANHQHLVSFDLNERIKEAFKNGDTVELSSRISNSNLGEYEIDFDSFE